VGPRAGLAGAENLAPTGIRSPDRPARSQSLYRLSYPTHGITINATKFIRRSFTILSTLENSVTNIKNVTSVDYIRIVSTLL
jgi:hypothetical protein